MRSHFHSQMFQHNCFITLTYDTENIPTDNSVQKNHFQLFMKRLRKNLEPKKISFFHCGEYGDQFKRPHYHALLFNHDFPDKIPYKETSQGHILYTSKELDSTWGLGRTDLGTVSFNSASYVARYTVKKFTNPDPDKVLEHYTWFNEDGTLTIHKPEYATMSEKIGYAWFFKYYQDIYPKDFITINGQKCPPPIYFDELLKIHDENLYDLVKTQRQKLKVNEHRPTRDTWKETPSILSKLQVQEAQLTNLKRNL